MTASRSLPLALRGSAGSTGSEAPASHGRGRSPSPPAARAPAMTAYSQTDAPRRVRRRPAAAQSSVGPTLVPAGARPWATRAGRRGARSPAHLVRHLRPADRATLTQACRSRWSAPPCSPWSALRAPGVFEHEPVVSAEGGSQLNRRGASRSGSSAPMLNPRVSEGRGARAKLHPPLASPPGAGGVSPRTRPPTTRWIAHRAPSSFGPRQAPSGADGR